MHTQNTFTLLCLLALPSLYGAANNVSAQAKATDIYRHEFNTVFTNNMDEYELYNPGENISTDVSICTNYNNQALAHFVANAFCLHFQSCFDAVEKPKTGDFKGSEKIRVAINKTFPLITKLIHAEIAKGEHSELNLRMTSSEPSRVVSFSASFKEERNFPIGVASGSGGPQNVLPGIIFKKYNVYNS